MSNGHGVFIEVPKFGETRDKAFQVLRESGAQLRQRERVYWAIAYLEPVTRAQLSEFFNRTDWLIKGRALSASSVTARVRELIDEGRVRCIGTQKDHRTGVEVELLALGRDTRGKPLRSKPEPSSPLGFSSSDERTPPPSRDRSAMRLACFLCFLLGIFLGWVISR